MNTEMSGQLACYLSPQQACEAVALAAQGRINFGPAFINFGTVRFAPSYNISPSQTVLVLTDSIHFQPDGLAAKYVITPMRWSLSRDWTKANAPNNTHHTRIETLMDSSMSAVEMKRQHRGVLLCNGYYAWETIGRKIAQPYYCYRKGKKGGVADAPLLMLPVIFNKHITENHEMNISCSVITVESREGLSFVPHRLPMVMDLFMSVKIWIDPETSLRSSYELLKRSICYDITSYKVNRKHLLDLATNSEKCIERF